MTELTKERREELRVLGERTGHAPIGFNAMSGPEPNLSGDELRALLDERDRYRALLEDALRALRYLHNFPNATAAHANAAKIIPSDAEFDRMARANDAALEGKTND